MNISVICFTARGADTAVRIFSYFEKEKGWNCRCWIRKKELSGKEKYLFSVVDEDLSEWTGSRFTDTDVLIFVGAAGIAVRAAAPHLRSKASDPAVLCVDEAARFVIPLLSGHIGGANERAVELAAALDAIPVVTTATDLNGKFAVDVFAVRNQLRIAELTMAKDVSAAILDKKKIGFICDGDVKGRLPDELMMIEDENVSWEAWDDCDILVRVSPFSEPTGSHRAEKSEQTGAGSTWVSGRAEEKPEQTDTDSHWVSGRAEKPEQTDTDSHWVSGKTGKTELTGRHNQWVFAGAEKSVPHDRYSQNETGGKKVLHLIPAVVTLGIGCRKEKDPEQLWEFISEELWHHRIFPQAVEQICTIDRKAGEPAILAAADRLQVPLRTFSAEELASMQGEFSVSSFVLQQMGVDNVCERSAVKGSGGELIIRKTARDGMTMAAAIRKWSVSFE